MTRGNQREKAREKNLKDSAASVSRVTSTAASQIPQKATSRTPIEIWQTQATDNNIATEKEEHTIWH